MLHCKMDEAPFIGNKIMDWKKISSALRADIIDMSYRSKAAHLASALSCADILSVLYASILHVDPKKPSDKSRDRFILSKGHAASALYSALSYKGFLNHNDLENYGQKDSLLEEHPSPRLKGVEAATGSLGHGLPIANGMALGAKILKQKYRVFVLMSDGECNEGSVWEGALFTATHKLNSITAIVDFNKWQATGRSREVMQLDPLADKWKAFGWKVLEIDGHDHQQLFDALTKKDQEQPIMIIAHTVKGKGISFMEDDNNWHYRIPTENEVIAAKSELEAL